MTDVVGNAHEKNPSDNKNKYQKMMMMMTVTMPLTVEAEFSARWLKNTQKALVVQLRSAEQDSDGREGLAGEREEKQVCFVLS